MIHVTKEKSFNDKTHRTDEQRTDDEAEPEIFSQQAQIREAALSTQHVETAVGEI
jgi:hypothetical protein